MTDVKYKVKVGTRYKLDGEWWELYPTDSIVTLEDLDMGGYVYGIILKSVNKNELRVVSERFFDSLKPISVDIEPDELMAYIRYKPKQNDMPYSCYELCNKVLELLNYEGGVQIDFPQLIADGNEITYFLKLQKGREPLNVLLVNIESIVSQLGMEIVGVRNGGVGE